MNKMTIKELSSKWITYKKDFIKKSSLSTYQLIIINHIIPSFGNNKNIFNDDVQNFIIDKINSGLSIKMVKDIIVVLKMILSFGNEKKIFFSEKLNVRFPKEYKNNKLEILTVHEQKKIMKYIRNNMNFMNLGILICLSSGLRIGEVCALRWKNIDIKNKLINIRSTLQRIYFINENKRYTKLILSKPKTTNSIRDIPLSTELLDIFKKNYNKYNPDFFILSNSREPIEPRRYRNYYKNLCLELNINVHKFHSLRHTFATRCIESNANYKAVSEILGHSNINTTLNLYVHPNDNEKRKCINAMLKKF